MEKSLKECIADCFIYQLREWDWGQEIWLMERRGKASVRLYWFKDTPNIAYIEGVYVILSERKKGLGTILFNQIEKIANVLKINELCLSVEKNQWMYDWYLRQKYEWYSNDERDINKIWMVKYIIFQ